MDILGFLKNPESDGYGDGDGSGSGYGYGYGSGIKSLCGDNVYYIDGVATIIKHIKGNVAKGFILATDLTLSPCYVVKKSGYFAHGTTLKEATFEVVRKELSDMDAESKAEEFKKKFNSGEKYPAKDFFEWHGILTGSCKIGRESFVSDNEIDLNRKYTLAEFVDICGDSYGGDIIKKLTEDM